MNATIQNAAFFSATLLAFVLADRGSFAETPRKLGAPTVVYVNPDGSVGTGGLILSSDLLHALAEIEKSGGKVGDNLRAVRFKSNRAINRARLLGWLPDSTYQAAQKDFAHLNEDFGRRAAADVGAEFTPQASKSQSYKPGTDSDYITKVRNAEQITQMQAAYSKRINNFLKANGVVEAQDNWEELLDTDFMADPNYVDNVEFEDIATRNNDAYARRLAAEYERVSRVKTKIVYPDGTTEVLPQEITPELVREYVLEMVDFANKKDGKIAQVMQAPQSLDDPAIDADVSRMMMQEQKYIDRINAANDAVRAQNGLSAMEHGLPTLEVTQPQPPAIAELGAVRAPENRGAALAASSVAENSLNRSLAQMAETIAQLSPKNARFAVTAPGDIARITNVLSPAELGALIEQLRLLAGDNFAAKVAKAMRTASPPVGDVSTKDVAAAEAQARQQAANTTPRAGTVAALARGLDDAVKAQLRLSDDFSKLSVSRQQFNMMARNWMPRINAMLNVYFAGKTVLETGTDFRAYVFNLASAWDPATPDAVAQRNMATAHELAVRMAARGTLGAGMLGLMEAFPTIGAVLGTFAASYQGGRWVLENTSTGETIDRTVGSGFDAAISGAESLTDTLNEWNGGESRATRENNERTALLQAYANALRRGQIVLQPGVTARDLVDAILRGDLPAKINALLLDKDIKPVSCGNGVVFHFASTYLDPNLYETLSCTKPATNDDAPISACVVQCNRAFPPMKNAMKNSDCILHNCQ